MRSSSNRPSPSLSRGDLRQFLAGLIRREKNDADVKRGRLLLESLESRQLMAGDVELLFTGGEDQAAASEPVQTSEALTSSRVAEGEQAPDLVQFAKDLEAAGVIYYGAHWCPACTEQKELFGDGKDDLPFFEVTNGDRTLNQLGQDQQITQFPTWFFPNQPVDQQREIGVLSLATLSEKSGVPIPQSDQPTFEPIGNTTVQIGSPLHIPVDAYDPDGGPLTVTVSVDNPALLQGTVLSGNRSIRVDMNGYGDMVFELFEQRAPVASGRVADLAEDGFYDGIIFHRVTGNFVIQAGDPTGTGTSGSSLGNFDDDFHPELQHNRSGVLSFAKSSDDTNNSQFFVTEVPTRFLDFNHSIFGQLVEGEDVREAISSTSTPESRGVGSSQRPDIDAVINTVEVFEDTENAVVMLKATGSGTGSTNVTVTVTDQDGNTHSETFLVNVVQDTANGQPFLNDVQTPAPTPQNTDATLQLSSIDVEGDPVTYFAQSLSGGANGTVSVDSSTGLVTVTPAAGFEGTINVQVGVEPGPGVTGNSSSDFDSQTVPFTFQGGVLTTPTSVDLQTGSDSGSSNIDNITNSGSLTFTVTGVTDGATVELVETTSGSVVGSGFAIGSSVTISTNNIAALGDGGYTIAARQRNATETSGLSDPLALVYDTTSPASVIASAATQANVGRLFQTDLVSDEEGSGLRYSLASAPAGASINSTTGVIDWTPIANQLGSNTFALDLTDAAGNTRSESFSVDVAGAPLAEIKLELVDLQGAPITSIAVGQQFLMRFIGVDVRQFAFDRDGVFAAFADILFDSSLVRPVPGSTIDYADRFPSVNKGTIADGLIDELGAATDRLVASEIEESLIATIRFEALAAGTVNIRSEPADDADSEVLLYGNDNQIAANEVAYGSASLAIGQSFTVANDNFAVNEDSGSTVLDVLANDVVVSGSGSLTVVSVTQPATGGQVTVEAGEVAFVPTADFNGEVEFTYRVSDSNGIQADATVTVSVNAVNDPPTGLADTFNVNQNSTDNTLDVLSNDTITPDAGELLTVSNVGSSAQGATVTVASDGQSVIYTPAAGFTGTDTFTYTVSDGALTDEVTVNVTVAPADDPPTAVDDSFPGTDEGAIAEDSAQASYDVLANDTRDVDNQEFSISAVGAPSQGGLASVSSDGTQLLYAPAANFNGTETVTYTIRDSGGGLSVGTVTFTVSAENDAPPVANPTVQLNRSSGEKLALGLDGLPVNVDAGETLTFANLGTPTAGGSVRIDSATGSIFYTPPSNDFTGTDTFTYDVEDGSGLTSTGTITVDVSDFTERDIFINFPSGVDRRFSGITLSGTDALGGSVSRTLLYQSTDSAVFDNVLPGQYTVEIPAIPFLQGAETPQQIAVTSNADDGDMTVEADLGRLRPEFISIHDWLGSAPVKSILVVVKPGEAAIFASPSSSVDTINDPQVDLDSTGSTLTIRGTRQDAVGTVVDVEATLPASGDARVQTRGEALGLKLFRISVEDGDVNFAAPVASSAAEGESLRAEGESIAAASQSPAQPLAADVAEATQQSTMVGRQAEGEAATIESTTVADVFVPAAQQVDTRTDATVISLESGDLWVGQSLVDEDSDRPVDASAMVDAAMTDVADELTLVPTGQASNPADSANLDESAIDAVLQSNLG
jgi:cyclophilin family peptidyl-prolyl cis-trans isomerase